MKNKSVGTFLEDQAWPARIVEVVVFTHQYIGSSFSAVYVTERRNTRHEIKYYAA